MVRWRTDLKARKEQHGRHPQIAGAPIMPTTFYALLHDFHYITAELRTLLFGVLLFLS
jgi:hypothetical protein